MNTQWTTRDVLTFAVLLGILFLAGIAAWKGDRVDSKIGGVPQKVEVRATMVPDTLESDVTQQSTGRVIHVTCHRAEGEGDVAFIRRFTDLCDAVAAS